MGLKNKLITFTIILTVCILHKPITLKAAPREHYLIQIYHCSSQQQIDCIDQYLKVTYLPYLHSIGIPKVGVFTPIVNDTSKDKRLFVWIPLRSLETFEMLDQNIEKIDPMGFEKIIHLALADSSAPYTRIETIFSKAFKEQPQFVKTTSLAKKENDERIFEFRSYESMTENMHLRKIHMFNEGKEIELFDRLQFNALFYAKVLAGANMPNLIYMTSFKNMSDREAHWKAFSADPYWKKISTDPIYLKTVSKADIILMKAKAYADF
jgi:hypothetical protein